MWYIQTHKQAHIYCVRVWLWSVCSCVCVHRVQFEVARGDWFNISRLPFNNSMMYLIYSNVQNATHSIFYSCNVQTTVDAMQSYQFNTSLELFKSLKGSTEKGLMLILLYIGYFIFISILLMQLNTLIHGWWSILRTNI